MPETDGEVLVTPGMGWYVLCVTANKESKIRETLVSKIRIEGMQEYVRRILVPTEKIKTVKQGKRRIVEKKLYPGYIFVEMKVEEDGRIPQDVFFLFKETNGVGDFIGTPRPSKMQDHEVESLMREIRKQQESGPEVKTEFQPGDAVRVREGPFQNMEGKVEILLPDQGKVRVNVTIFGRATPIELEYWLVERAD